MKKLIAVSILLALLSTAAFAELKVSFWLDITQNLFSGQTYLDDWTTRTHYRGPGKVDFFTNTGETWRGSEMMITLDYRKENIRANIEFNGHNMVIGNDTVFTQGPGNTNSFHDVLEKFFIENYFVEGNLGKLYAQYGNRADRGAMNAFRFDAGQTGWWNRRASGYWEVPRFFGVQSVGGFINGNDWQRIFRRNQNSNPGLSTVGTQDNFHQGYMLVRANVLDNLSVEIAGSRREAEAGDNGSRISLGARVSGRKIADFLTFDALYHVQGGDPTMNSDYNPAGVAGYPAGGRHDEADGAGLWGHRFGLYAGVGLLDDNLMVSFGYTGYVVGQEQISKLNDTRGLSKGTEDYFVYHPLYSGIDLRAQFKAGDLTLAFNNNFSFAAVKGTSNLDRAGIYTGILGKDEEQSFFALSNALAVGYQVTSEFDVVFQAINWAQWHYAKNHAGNTLVENVQDRFGVSLTAGYSFNPNFRLMGGLAMRLNHTTRTDGASAQARLQHSGPGGENLELAPGASKVGNFYFGIPITFLVTW